MSRLDLRRAAALVALWAYVLGTLCGTAHLALTRHTVCADHGQIVHGEALCAAPSELAACVADAAPDAGADGPRVVAADATEAEHEHCATAFALRADLRVEPSPAAACDAPPALVPCESRAGLLRVQDDLLSFAPKQSPPA